MASEDEKLLLTRLLNPTATNGQTTNSKGKRYRRCRSAPLSEFHPGEVTSADDSHPSDESQSFWEKLHPSSRKATLYLTIYLSVGTVCFYFVNDQLAGNKIDGVLDSLYFCVVTMTTLGYGDLVPNSTATKLLACAFVFSGMALIGLLISKRADYMVEKQENLLIGAMRMREKFGPSEILKDLENNRARYKCILMAALLVVLLSVGILFLTAVENLDVVDALYCVCSTVTTLGYGDKTFSTKAGRVFAVFWILTSSITLAQLFACIAELNTESRQKSLVKYVLTRKMTNVDLEEADIDDDRLVGPAEFVLYKLKEMGKVKQEDILPWLQEFQNLDVDQSGTLSTADLILAQSNA